MPEITLLGTGGMLPLKDRFLTSLYAEFDGRAVLIDCGEGTQVAAAKHGIKLSRIEAICFTHLHADHVVGLPGLLLSVGNTGRTAPMPIYCGKSTADMLRHLLCVTGGLPFDVQLHILPEDTCTRVKLPEISPLVTLETLPLRHRVPCLGYRLVLHKKPEFLPEQARQLDIPVQLWSRLHAGETVTLPDGREILPSQVTGAMRPPLRIVYTTDTLPIPEIAGFAAGADLFVCEGMWGAEEKKDSMNKKRHMLMQDACRLAAKADVKRLWLTHYSPAEKSPADYADVLRGIFAGVTISGDGEHIALK